MKILVVFGTRPEAIKMALLAKKLNDQAGIEVKVCVTAQHREMLDQVLDIFEIKPGYDLDIMQANQDLFDITSKILLGMREALREYQPDLVLVHGDTSTTLATSLACFYEKVKIGHIEAGLRTWDLQSPWPEEANRQITSVVADYHFAPTELSKQNLIKENKLSENIVVTGNTVIDSLLWVKSKITEQSELKTSLETQFSFLNDYDRFVLITGHRRENFGQGFENICEAISKLAQKYSDVGFLYPVHLNPNVQGPVNSLLKNKENVFLIEPLEYVPFVYLMDRSYLILTDSGGIQEEAPSLGKPVLVMRDTTERPEAIEAGTVLLVGTDTDKIVSSASILLDKPEEYHKMSFAHNPYGDGQANSRICKFIQSKKNEI